MEAIKSSVGVTRIGLVRLLTRLIRLHALNGPAKVDLTTSAGGDAWSNDDEWYDLVQRRFSSVKSSLGVVFSEEKLIGRGSDNRGSFPHSHFCKALVDAALAVDLFRASYPLRVRFVASTPFSVCFVPSDLSCIVSGVGGGSGGGR